MTLAEETVAKASDDQTQDDQTAEPAEAAPAPAEDAAAPAQEAAEQLPDGVVEHAPAGSANDAGADDEAAAADEPQVDVAVLEALLFSSHHPLTAGRLGELLQLQSTKPIRRAIKDLNQVYADTGRSFRVEQVAGGYQLLTLPEYGDVLQQMHQREADTKLTKSALETLAIVAYKQPILRADVEAIRGVACGETIRSLMEKHLVKIAGRAELPGRPILYGTTKRFLELFGLNSLKDLPQQQDSLPKPQAKKEEPAPAAPPAAAAAPEAPPQPE